MEKMKNPENSKTGLKFLKKCTFFKFFSPILEFSGFFHFPNEVFWSFQKSSHLGKTKKTLCARAPEARVPGEALGVVMRPSQQSVSRGRPWPGATERHELPRSNHDFTMQR